MKPRVFFVAIPVFIGAASITFAILCWLDSESEYDFLPFVAGSILALQLAILTHQSSPEATNSAKVRLAIAAAIGLTAAPFGIALHFIFDPFRYPGISLSMGTAGSFMLSYLLFESVWKGFKRAKA